MSEIESRSGRIDLMGTIIRFRPLDKEVEIYATGLRNTYGISIRPDGILYGVDNDRPPQKEELNALTQDGFYEYPFWGTNEAPPEENVTEPIAVLPGSLHLRLRQHRQNLRNLSVH